MASHFSCDAHLRCLDTIYFFELEDWLEYLVYRAGKMRGMI